MKNYGTILSECTYHFVFVTRYCRKIFRYDGVAEAFCRLAQEKCKELNVEILTCQCKEYHVLMSMECPPEVSPAAIMGTLKSTTSAILRREFECLFRMPSLWTRNYLVSTKPLSQESITAFLGMQRKK